MSMSFDRDILLALLESATVADSSGNHYIADASDETALRIAQTLPAMGKSLVNYLGADEAAGRLLGKNTITQNTGKYVYEDLLSPENLVFQTVAFLENAQFDNMLRSQLIKNGFLSLEDKEAWRAFKADKGRHGLESLLREVSDANEVKRILGKEKMPIKDVAGFWRKTGTLLFKNRVVDLENFWRRRIAAWSKGGLHGAENRAKLRQDFISNKTQLNPELSAGELRSKHSKPVTTHVAKNQLMTVMENLSADGQKRVAGLLKEVQSGSFNNERWLPALRKSASQVVDKNSAAVGRAIRGIKPGNAGKMIKGLAKKLGPAIVIAAFTTLVEEYVEQDPKYKEFAKNPTNNIPGGVAGSIVAYSLPFVGQALMAWDIGWSIGRIVANIPWVHDQLSEIGVGLESIYTDGVDATELKHQTTLENELDSGKYALYMRNQFTQLVHSGVAIDQAWSAILKRMKSDGASQDAILYVRKQYTDMKQSLSESGAYGKAQMPIVSTEQESRALSEIKLNIDKMIEAGNADSVIRNYLTSRLNTVADLNAKQRLQKSALQYLSTRKSNPVASTPAPQPLSANLSRGSKGRAVAAWQQFLHTQGLMNHNPKTPDVFGPMTEAGTRAFQQKHQLRVDGIVGPETLGKARQLGGKL